MPPTTEPSIPYGYPAGTDEQNLKLVLSNFRTAIETINLLETLAVGIFGCKVIDRGPGVIR
jgi:hypothetical protein